MTGLGASDATRIVAAGQLTVVGLGVNAGSTQTNVNAGMLSVVGANQVPANRTAPTEAPLISPTRPVQRQSHSS